MMQCRLVRTFVVLPFFYESRSELDFITDPPDSILPPNLTSFHFLSLLSYLILVVTTFIPFHQLTPHLA